MKDHTLKFMDCFSMQGVWQVGLLFTTHVIYGNEQIKVCIKSDIVKSGVMNEQGMCHISTCNASRHCTKGSKMLGSAFPVVTVPHR